MPAPRATLPSGLEFEIDASLDRLELDGDAGSAEERARDSERRVDGVLGGLRDARGSSSSKVDLNAAFGNGLEPASSRSGSPKAGDGGTNVELETTRAGSEDDVVIADDLAVVDDDDRTDASSRYRSE